jgi:hypothetical protein
MYDVQRNSITIADIIIIIIIIIKDSILRYHDYQPTWNHCKS